MLRLVLEDCHRLVHLKKSAAKNGQNSDQAASIFLFEKVWLVESYCQASSFGRGSMKRIWLVLFCYVLVCHGSHRCVAKFCDAVGVSQWVDKGVCSTSRAQKWGRLSSTACSSYPEQHSKSKQRKNKVPHQLKARAAKPLCPDRLLKERFSLDRILTSTEMTEIATDGAS